MFNMLKLEWLCMKSYRKALYLTPFAGIALAVLVHPVFALMALPYLMHDFGANSFMAGEKGEVDRLFLSLPIKRIMIIRTRFVLMLITGGIGLLAGIVITLLASPLLYGHTILQEHTFIPDFNTMLLLVVSSILTCAIMNLFLLPTLCKAGYSVAKYRGTFILVGLASLLVIVRQLIERIKIVNYHATLAFEWALSNIIWTSAILLGIAIALFATSYALAQKNYSKREF